VTNVPSYTSSSNDRLPVGGWPRTWAAVLLLTALPLALWDGYLRTHGFRPQVLAPDEGFMLSLAAVPRATTVVLGTSRIQAALDPGPFREVMGGRPPVNLALAGESPLPLLEYLADSTAWSGLLVVELLPYYAFDGTQEGAASATRLLARFARDRVSPASMTESWLRVHVSQYLAFREPDLLPARLIETLRAGRRPEPWVLHLRPDRFGPLALRALVTKRRWDARTGFQDVGYQRIETNGKPASDAEYAAITARIEHATNRILDRGGRVAFVYLAACGRRLEIEERRFPRARYWDPLAARTRAVAIASADIPELTRFACFDGSHIDEHDAPAYSRGLADAIKAALASGRTGAWPPASR